jgi:predicted nucleic acid-binding protein
MPETQRIVINTSPLIALVSALGNLTVLQSLYTQVLVPFEVCQELLVGGSNAFAVAEFEAAHWLQKQSTPLEISPILINSLDRGEAYDALQYLIASANEQMLCSTNFTKSHSSAIAIFNSMC